MPIAAPGTAGHPPVAHERVEASLEADVKMKDVHVASVNNGVVLLSGKTDGLDQDLRAIENAYSVKGVHRVASELKTTDKSTRNP